LFPDHACPSSASCKVTTTAACKLIKSLLLFRYGLPVNFQAMLLAPQKKSQKRLREVLNHLYAHLDNSATGPAGTDVSIYVYACL